MNKRDSRITHHEAIVLGAGVSGIYLIKRLVDLNFDAIVLEADDDLGGTWYRNRYPGCRFDSESYTYGYSFSQELLDEWHWKERFSSQPENLRYLNFVAGKFGLRRHMKFNARVTAMEWDEEERLWYLSLENGETFSAQFVISGMGVLSVPTLPDYPGLEDFRGPAFHTYWWPQKPVTLEGKKVAVIGTGATGIQVIAEIADKVKELTVFQRRPNWSTPLNNSEISEEEMAEIRSRYDEIFTKCANSPNSFEHSPDRRGFWNLTHKERRATWDRLYDTPGFALLAGNFPEIFLDESANKEISDYVAERVRQRVHDPIIAEKLIPKDHGFGTQRLPLETNYFEAYNRNNVRLVDITEDPIEKVYSNGILTSTSRYDLDMIVLATGFDPITGAWDRIEITGVDGLLLGEKWKDTPKTYYGLMNHGFPNLFMVAGPQSVSGSTNFPRAIEASVEWITDLLVHSKSQAVDRIEAQANAEKEWHNEVVRAHERLLARRSKSWFTGYNANITGREPGTVRYHAYFGGGPKHAALIRQTAEAGYPDIDMTAATDN